MNTDAKSSYADFTNCHELPARASFADGQRKCRTGFLPVSLQSNDLVSSKPAAFRPYDWTGRIVAQRPLSSSGESALETTGSPLPAMTADEPEELRRVQALVANSPDLINRLSGDPSDYFRNNQSELTSAATREAAFQRFAELWQSIWWTTGVPLVQAGTHDQGSICSGWSMTAGRTTPRRKCRSNSDDTNRHLPV